MRHGKLWAVLVVLVAAGCSPSKSLKDMVGYVPPTSFPAQPKRTLVADKPERVWIQLVEFLEASAFQIEHTDEEKNLLIARYSGDPGPYIDCGSIVTHENGTLGQIAGSAPAVSLNYELEEKPVILNRSLNLDSRIIIRLVGQPQGTVIRTDTTYVVTKTIDVAASSGAIREGSRETVSFEAGGRGEFSKGTACQPNGSLDLAVLQNLSNIVSSDEIDRTDLNSDGIETFNDIPSNNETVAAPPDKTRARVSPRSRDTAEDQVDISAQDLEGTDAAKVPLPQSDDNSDDWVLPEQGLPTAALPTPKPTEPALEPPTTNGRRTTANAAPSQPLPTTPPPNTAATSEKNALSRAESHTETAPSKREQSAAISAVTDSTSPASIVEDTTRKLLESLDCKGEEWHFCDLVQLTTPLRKNNIEKLFGLTINTTESFTSQVIGRDLKLDILFPSFPSNLHIAYVRRNGTVEHVMSSPEVWPADLTHQLAQTNQTIPGPPGLAMIVAIASDEPLFSSPPDSAEDATVYLGRLKQRLTQIETENPGGPIAASQLLIYVENDET
ncbi:MAG: hypothetical protein ACR2RF_15225 [Geminicoccaceae bacterium]